MPELALAFYCVYLGLAFALRSLLQRRRTGTTGFKGISGSPGSAEWLGGVLFVVAFIGGIAAPILDLADVLEPVGALDRQWLQWIGAGIFVFGLCLTLVSQEAMGRSWRIGVDASERTDLVTKGPFQLVRNPIFAAMLPASLGLVLMVPNLVALASFLALVAALEIQTRLVEEPYLLRTHGESYAGYARKVGRFVPGVGTLRTHDSARTSRRLC